MTILETLQQFRDDMIELLKNNLKIKVDKEEGMGLSQNSFTNEEKRKLANIKDNATNVSFLPSVTKGDKIGDISINGKSKSMYSPSYSISRDGKNVKLTSTDGTSSSVKVPNVTDSLDTVDSDTAISATAGKNLQEQITDVQSSVNDLNIGKEDLQEQITDIQSSVNDLAANKADKDHGRHVPNTCEEITNWNNATKTGWYMGYQASNAPDNSSWYMGYVVAHNTNYVFQEVYQFTASTDAKAVLKYIRCKMNGTWGAWVNVTVQKAVPSDAKFTDTTYNLGSFGITATAAELNYTDGVTSNIQTQLNGKAASNHSHSNYAASNHTHNNYAASSHTHNYAGSSSAGGSATSAVSASSSKSTVTTSCLRNIQASTTDLTAGSSSLTTGDIYIVYE